MKKYCSFKQRHFIIQSFSDDPRPYCRPIVRVERPGGMRRSIEHLSCLLPVRISGPRHVPHTGTPPLCCSSLPAGELCPSGLGHSARWDSSWWQFQWLKTCLDTDSLSYKSCLWLVPFLHTDKYLQSSWPQAPAPSWPASSGWGPTSGWTASSGTSTPARSTGSSLASLTGTGRTYLSIGLGSNKGIRTNYDKSNVRLLPL